MGISLSEYGSERFQARLMRLSEHGSEGFRVRLMRLSEYGSVLLPLLRPTRETQAEQYSDTVLHKLAGFKQALGGVFCRSA